MNELLRRDGPVDGACRACIVRQFARQIPVESQLPCVQGAVQARALRDVGTDRPLSAVKLLLRSSATSERALFLSKDAAIHPPLANSPTDPTLFGARVELCSAQGTAVFDLPADLWHMSGNGSVFKFTRPGAGADVKMALVKGGRTLKVVSRAVGIPLPGSLGPVGVRVTTGDVRNCALFGLDTILRDEPGKYVAQSALAGAIADCENASLGCDGGF